MDPENGATEPEVAKRPETTEHPSASQSLLPSADIHFLFCLLSRKRVAGDLQNRSGTFPSRDHCGVDFMSSAIEERVGFNPLGVDKS